MKEMERLFILKETKFDSLRVENMVIITASRRKCEKEALLKPAHLNINSN